MTSLEKAVNLLRFAYAHLPTGYTFRQIGEFLEAYDEPITPQRDNKTSVCPECKNSIVYGWCSICDGER